jgi:hypothetical protein
MFVLAPDLLWEEARSGKSEPSTCQIRFSMAAQEEMQNKVWGGERSQALFAWDGKGFTGNW